MQCHSDKYETYIQTGMGMSLDTASRKKTSAAFTGHDVIYDEFKNLSYFPHWVNDSFFVTEFRISNRDTIYKRKEYVSWIVGSGQHTNSHLVNFKGYVYQAPVTFYTQKAKWDLPPGFENGFNSRFSRMIGLECISCHNAYPKIEVGSENKYSLIPDGIDCERCHGPGSKHIENMQAGKLVDVNQYIDYTIVNPAKLPVDLQMDVCQRCHIQGNTVLNDDKSFLDFKPGMKLSDVMNVYMPVYKGDDDSHIMASHVERLKMSECFLVTTKKAEALNNQNPSLTPYKNSMTCVTCHNPHVSVKKEDKNYFNNKCRSCHFVPHEKVESKSIAASNINCSLPMSERLKSNDNCVSCHMPKNNSIDIPHVSVTDHWIRTPMKKHEVDNIKEFAGLACINNPAAGDKSLGKAYLSYFEKFSSNPAYLDSAKKYISDDNLDSIKSNFQSLIRWAFLNKNYKKVIEYSNLNQGFLKKKNKISVMNEDAWTYYRIGESYYAEGDIYNSISYFKKATECAPLQLDFRNKFAGALLDGGSIEEARKNYEFIIEENPKYTSAYISLGYLILTVDKDPLLAEKLYDKALSLDPDNLQALLNKAGVKLLQDKKKDAIWYLKEVLKRDAQNHQAKILLNRLG
jgi:Flp pilus assembly protein TadD